MAILIITDNQVSAAHVAASLGGIMCDGKRPVKYDDIEKNAELINKTIKESKALKTAFAKTDAFVTWLSKDPLIEGESKDILSFEDVKLKKPDFERITDKRYLNAKGRLDAVYFALLDTENNQRTKLLVMRMLSVENRSFYDVDINEMSQEGIMQSFSSPVPINEYTECITEASLRNLCQTNIETLILGKTGVKLTSYELACMGLLHKRQKLTDKNEKQCSFQASLQINGIACSSSVSEKISRKEAEAIMKTLPDYVTAQGPSSEGLMTTADIYDLKSLDDVLSENENGKNIDDILRKLYGQGYISRPYTQSENLPQRYDDVQLRRIAKICAEKSDTLTEKEIFEVLQRLRPDSISPKSAIVPLMAPREHMPLGRQEEIVYEYIVDTTLAKIEECTYDRFEFKSGELSFYTLLQIPAIKEYARKGKKIAARYMALDKKGGKRFSSYTCGEMLKELEKKHIGSPDIYRRTIEQLLKKKLIKVSGNVVTLTPEGKELAAKIPVGDEFFYVCRQLDEVIIKSQEPISQKKLMGAFSTVLDQAAEKTEEEVEEKAEKEEKGLETIFGGIPKVEIKKNKEGISTNSETKNSKPSDSETKISGKSNSETKNPRGLNPETKVPEGQNPETKTSESVKRVSRRAVMKCPVCGKGVIILEEKSYRCESCGTNIPKLFNYEGYLFPVAEKDVSNLLVKGRTSYKFGKNMETGDMLAAFILYENGKCDITNESTTKCPVCGKPLYVYDWGFACESCSFNVPFSVYKVRLQNSDLKKLLNGEESGVINGLTFRDGRVLSGTIKINEKGQAQVFVR